METDTFKDACSQANDKIIPQAKKIAEDVKPTWAKIGAVLTFGLVYAGLMVLVVVRQLWLMAYKLFEKPSTGTVQPLSPPPPPPPPPFIDRETDKP